MDNKKILFSIIGSILLLIVAILSFTPIQNAKTQTPIVWEYKFEQAVSEKKANELGAQGWELAGIQSPSGGMAHPIPIYVFKRQKQ